MQLSFDGPRVRYEVTFSRSPRIGIAAAMLLLGGASCMLAGGQLSSSLLFGVGFVGLGVGLGLFFSDGFLGTTNARQRARAAIAKLLQREIADAHAEDRFRVQVGGGAAERAKAVIAVLEARNVALTDEERARILAAPDEATASRWLTNAATATAVAEVLDDDAVNGPPRAKDRQST